MHIMDNKQAHTVYHLSDIIVPGLSGTDSDPSVSSGEALGVATDGLLSSAEDALLQGSIDVFTQVASLTLSLLRADDSSMDTSDNSTDDGSSSSASGGGGSLSPSSSTSTATVAAETGQRVREGLFNLTRALAATLATTGSQTTSQLVVSLVSSTCSEPTQLNHAVRLGSLGLLSTCFYLSSLSLLSLIALIAHMLYLFIHMLVQ